MKRHLSKYLSRRAFLVTLFAPTGLALADWGEFRGDGSSLLINQNALPVQWSEQKNVSWNIITPGYGQSSPVIFNQRVFVTSVAKAEKEPLMLTAFNLSDGKELWNYQTPPAQSIHYSDMISTAAPTPAIDEAGIYAFFETGNLVGLDHQGQLQWERRLTHEFGAFGGRHGIGSSLRLCQSGVIALVDHEGPSYLICVDRRTGKTVWKTARRRKVSWTTPAVTEHNGHELTLVSSGDQVDAYDTRNGSLLWTLDGFKQAFVASPTPTTGGVIIGSSKKGWTSAIRFGATLSKKPRIVWRTTDATSYFSSPLVYGSHVYMVNKVGVAYCLDLETGQELWHQRLTGPCWASTIGANKLVYFFGINGVVEVFRIGDTPKKVAQNHLSSKSRLYGIAVEYGSLVLRFGRRLTCIQKS